MDNKTNGQKPINIVNSDTFVGSVYSQIVAVTVTDIDITLEFVYVNPRDKTKGQIVARVTLPKEQGKNLAEAILNTVLMHERKKGGKKDD